MELFVLISGTVSALAVFPLVYLALRSVRDAGEIREIHRELTGLVREAKELGEEVHAVQREMRNDQRDATDGIETIRGALAGVSESVEQVGSTVNRIDDVVADNAHAPGSRRAA